MLIRVLHNCVVNTFSRNLNFCLQRHVTYTKRPLCSYSDTIEMGKKGKQREKKRREEEAAAKGIPGFGSAKVSQKLESFTKKGDTSPAHQNHAATNDIHPAEAPAIKKEEKSTQESHRDGSQRSDATEAPAAPSPNKEGKSHTEENLHAAQKQDDTTASDTVENWEDHDNMTASNTTGEWETPGKEGQSNAAEKIFVEHEEIKTSTALMDADKRDKVSFTIASPDAKKGDAAHGLTETATAPRAFQKEKITPPAQEKVDGKREATDNVDEPSPVSEDGATIGKKKRKNKKARENQKKREAEGRDTKDNSDANSGRSGSRDRHRDDKKEHSGCKDRHRDDKKERDGSKDRHRDDKRDRSGSRGRREPRWDQGGSRKGGAMGALASQGFTYSEVFGDLFSCPAEASLAHCISADIEMGKGIAVHFKKKFGGVNELWNQNQTAGGMAYLKKGDRYIYYLVTKNDYWKKPTYNTLESSLKAMKVHCVENNVHMLAMPKIGCGLDGLKWNNVYEMIHNIFKGTGINITVYSI